MTASSVGSLRSSASAAEAEAEEEAEAEAEEEAEAEAEEEAEAEADEADKEEVVASPLPLPLEPLPLNSASSPDILLSAVMHSTSQPSRSARSSVDTVATVKVDNAFGDDGDDDDDDDDSDGEAAFFPFALATDASDSVVKSAEEDDDEADDAAVPAAAAPPTSSFHTALGQSRLSACLPRIDMPSSLPTKAYMLRCNCVSGAQISGGDKRVKILGGERIFAHFFSKQTMKRLVLDPHMSFFHM